MPAMDCALAAPVRCAERPWHVKGGTGATRRRERTRRAPSGWFLTRHRPGKAPPRWAEFILPKKGPKTREARIRSLKEAPYASLDAKRDSDKASAERWEDECVAEQVTEELAEIHGDVIEREATRLGISPLMMYAVMYLDRLGRLAGDYCKYEIFLAKDGVMYVNRVA